MPKISSKRPAAPPGGLGTNKRRKLATFSKNSTRSEQTAIKKERASERKVIPIPVTYDDPNDGSEVDEEDAEFFQSAAQSVDFLTNLDVNAIARSKHEARKLLRFEKAAQQPRPDRDDDLPSIHSHDDDETWDPDTSGSINSDIEGSIATVSNNEPGDVSNAEDQERWYEHSMRPRLGSELEGDLGAERLPVKLADGSIQSRGHLPLPPSDSESDSELDENLKEQSSNLPKVEDVATGARFGRPAVAAVIGTKSRKVRIQLAKEQIAGLCQDIVSDPENSMGLLRRLGSFALPFVTSPSEPGPVPNDPLIRRLALLSQLAVFKDIVPGYRIRPLTDKEKEEKVSQMVQRTRDYEQGLVNAYQVYLKLLEDEVKSKSDFSEVALQSMCTLLVELTHFNFRLNLMNAVVARLSRKSWDESSQRCLDTLITVLRNDHRGDASLQVVMLLNRMIKERRFQVHPNVLSCLTHLRLKSELGGVRASQNSLDKEEERNSFATKKKVKHSKYNDQPRLSKKQKKLMKEKKQIAAEMHEAAAEVDKEERGKTHTETLKLLFVLYFRILKSEKPTRMLSGALDGISRFAHLINIDFFKDLLAVLKTLITRGEDGDHQESDDETGRLLWNRRHEDRLRQRLLCIVTAFELLSGQGEALTIDLRDFVNFLYTTIPQLALSPDLDGAPSDSPSSSAPSQPYTQKGRPGSQVSLLDLLFRALRLIFMGWNSAGSHPSWRAAAFAKRLLTASLNWPTPSVLKTLEFVKSLMVREPTLEAMLSTEDRVTDGVYRPDVEDPQMSNVFATSLWELRLLARQHVDERVRFEGQDLAKFQH